MKKRESAMNSAFGYGMTIVRITRTGAVIVEACVPGSPADRAGIRPGAELIEFNGVRLHALDAEVCRVLLESCVPQHEGEIEHLRVRQDGKDHDITLSSAEIVWPPEHPALAKGDPALEQLVHRGVEIVEYADGSIGFELTGSLSDGAVNNVLARR